MAARVTSSFLPSFKYATTDPEVKRPPPAEKNEEPHTELEIPDWFLVISAIVLIPVEIMILPLYWLFYESVRERREVAEKKRLQKAKTRHAA